MSSRIFIKGLPPVISPEDFKNHFSKNFAITDAKLIPQRSIGYIGFQTPEDASKAVKYFNKSFIRMSRIGVELARPVSDSALPLSRKSQREIERQDTKSHKAIASSAPKFPLNAGTKRKRSDIDEEDPRLKEYLEVMQPASKVRTQTSLLEVKPLPETSDEINELPAAKSDEYKSMAMKSTPTNQEPPAAPPALLPPENLPITDCPGAATSSDAEWLRVRTNRLLDLVEPEQAVDLSQNKINIIVARDNLEPTSQVGSNPTVENQDTDKEVSGSNQESKLDDMIASIKATGRLFVRNLSYAATENDLREIFSVYGLLDEVHLPIDAEGGSKGFALIQFADYAAAAEAFHHLDGEPFQGRLLHILPGCAKRENKLDEYAISKLPLTKQKEIKKKANAASMTFNWNSLYMDQDAVNSAIAKKLGITKSEMLDPTSTESGWKQAIAETSIIQETKSYFAKNGVDLDSFRKRERGDTSILVKNFPYGMNNEELRKMFEEYGQVLRVLMPPAATIAIVEFSQPVHARAAFASLAYRRIKDSVLFLEKAPKDVFTSVSSDGIVNPSELNIGCTSKLKISVSDLLEPSPESDFLEISTLFIRNLNFTTTSERLVEIFQPLAGFLSARVNTKTDPKRPGQMLSMGFGFLEFKSEAQAQAALKAMDGYELDGHKLVIKASHKGVDAAAKRRREDRYQKMTSKRTKIIIKNLPFEATKNDVRGLFSAYGKLRSVRVPKKFDHSARGFAFADFVTAREAENALEALKDTHLLGRRLVLEFAANEATDAEEEIEKMQKKVTSQLNKVAIQELTGGGRKKFNIEDNNEEY